MKRGPIKEDFFKCRTDRMKEGSGIEDIGKRRHTCMGCHSGDPGQPRHYQRELRTREAKRKRKIKQEKKHLLIMYYVKYLRKHY